MCLAADKQFKIAEHYTKDLENQIEDTWVLSAQSVKQRELLVKHKKEHAIFVEGPHLTWIRGKMVNYFIMKTDPLPEIKEKMKQIESFEEDDLKNVHNIFSDPFNKDFAKNKKPELTIHEQSDGVIYALCCTGTSSKQSVLNWTKFLEESNQCLKDYVVLFRIKEAPGYVTEYRSPEDTKDKKQ